MKMSFAIQLRITYFLFPPHIYRTGWHNVSALHLSVRYDHFEKRPGTKPMLPEFSAEFIQHLQGKNLNYEQLHYW